MRQENKGKKKKNKKPKKKNESQEGNGEASGVETTEEKMKSEPAAAAFPPTFSVSEIKNKQRRHLMFMKLKQEKRKVKTFKYQAVISKLTLTSTSYHCNLIHLINVNVS